MQEFAPANEKAIAHVWACHRCTTIEKIVLLALACHVSNDQCEISYDEIAKLCELSKITVSRTIRNLVKRGLLKNQYRFDECNNKANVYDWLLPQGSAK